MVTSSIGAASNMMSSKQQTLILDQVKTLLESAKDYIYACKEGGGNSKVSQGLLCACARGEGF